MTCNKRRMLSIEEKVALIREIESGVKQADIVRHFGIKNSTISAIWQSRKKLLQAMLKDDNPSKHKKVRKLIYGDLDRVLAEWCREQMALNIPLQGPILRAKAVEFAEDLGIKSFKGSMGWVKKFKTRHKISFRVERVLLLEEIENNTKLKNKHEFLNQRDLKTNPESVNNRKLEKDHEFGYNQEFDGDFPCSVIIKEEKNNKTKNGTQCEVSIQPVPVKHYGKKTKSLRNCASDKGHTFDDGFSYKVKIEKDDDDLKQNETHYKEKKRQTAQLRECTPDRCIVIIKEEQEEAEEDQNHYGVSTRPISSNYGTNTNSFNSTHPKTKKGHDFRCDKNPDDDLSYNVNIEKQSNIVQSKTQNKEIKQHTLRLNECSPDRFKIEIEIEPMDEEYDSPRHEND